MSWGLKAHQATNPEFPRMYAISGGSSVEGHDTPLPTTIRTGFDVDPKHALKTLRPAHGCQRCVAVHATARGVGHHAIPVLEGWRKEPVKVG